MLEFLADIALTIFLAFLIAYIYNIVIDGGFGVIIKGRKEHNKVRKNIEQEVKEILKNGSGSSKQELQEWWDEHHKK